MSETTKDILTLIDTGVIVPGHEYYARRTDSWKWFGADRWWEVFVVFSNGMNGGGGACIEERWRWNSSNQTMRTEYRNLSYEETCELVDRILEHTATTSDRSNEVPE